jgi:hypothetical protein
MMTKTDEVLGGLFHACALTAFVEQAAIEQTWPNSATTRARAYRLYQQALADRDRMRDEIDREQPRPLRCSSTRKTQHG